MIESLLKCLMEGQEPLINGLDFVLSILRVLQDHLCQCEGIRDQLERINLPLLFEEQEYFYDLVAY